MQQVKRFKLTFSILSVCYILLGVLFVTQPTITENTICTIIGIAAILLGVIFIAYFFMRRDTTRAYSNDLAVGTVLIIAGIYLITWPSEVVGVLSVLLGFAIVFDSAIKAQYSLELNRVAFRWWWVVLIISIITAVLGILLIFKVFDAVVMWGVVLLIDGAANLLSTMAVSLLVKHANKKAHKNEKSADKNLKQAAKAEKRGAKKSAAFANDEVQDEAPAMPETGLSQEPLPEDATDTLPGDGLVEPQKPEE